jgi:hypothetical protein
VLATTLACNDATLPDEPRTESDKPALASGRQSQHVQTWSGEFTASDLQTGPDGPFLEVRHGFGRNYPVFVMYQDGLGGPGPRNAEPGAVFNVDENTIHIIFASGPFEGTLYLRLVG